MRRTIWLSVVLAARDGELMYEVATRPARGRVTFLALLAHLDRSVRRIRGRLVVVEVTRDTRRTETREHAWRRVALHAQAPSVT